MLFNSYTFLLLFLPVVLLGFHLIARTGRVAATQAWLVLASLFFYGWWKPEYLLLIVASILVNFGVGRLLSRKPSQPFLALGVTINLAVIGWFKYALFFAGIAEDLTSLDWTLQKVVLPLGISFFTFQQIAFLVDCHRGLARESSLLRYALFVTFFPQLIAGPIVHHGEVLSQFAKNLGSKMSSAHFAPGLTLFVIGLSKKVLLADSIAVYATPVFETADAGETLTFLEAWGGALAYTFQLYFDFSGYSDMALGLGRMFGIILPLNFNSPYKAVSIIDFWKRWHITLSHFLRDYLYIPLGGNRRGEARRLVNLMITMLLGGLWHGAGWTFVLWGGLHGLFLCVNHGWHRLSFRIPRLASQLLTFFVVVLAWVLFRAESLPGALAIYEGMLGLNGFSLPAWLAGNSPAADSGFGGVFGSGVEGFLWIGGLWMLAWYGPNSSQLLGDMPLREGERKVRWRYTRGTAYVLAALTLLCLAALSKPSEFLYFQF